jgi:hypothetical protein
MKASDTFTRSITDTSQADLNPLPDAPPVSLDDAISKPIYSLQQTASDEASSSEADKEDGEKEPNPKRRLQACILCPQRLFKNDKMVEDHVKSKVSPACRKAQGLVCSTHTPRIPGGLRWVRLVRSCHAESYSVPGTFRSTPTRPGYSDFGRSEEYRARHPGRLGEQEGGEEG